MNYTKDCIFIDESVFDINIKPSTARSTRGTPANVTTPSAKAISHSILGCNLSAWSSQHGDLCAFEAKKRKATATTTKTQGGTNADHFTNFIIKKPWMRWTGILNFKRFYLIIENSPIHGRNDELGQLIENRGCKCVDVPPYSPELNSIDQFLGNC